MRTSSFPLLEAILVLVLVQPLGFLASAGSGSLGYSRYGGNGQADSAGSMMLADDPIRQVSSEEPSAATDPAKPAEADTRFGTGVWETGFAGLALPSSYYSNVGEGLVIPGIEHFPESRILIFDSHGHRVYSQRGYSNSWTGTDREGHLLPTGTYFVIVEIDGLGDDVQAYLNLIH